MTRRRPLVRIAIALTVAVAVLSTPMVTYGRGPRPVNDDFSAAAAASGFPFTSTVDVSRITRTVDDPGPYCFNGGTVWYRLSSPDRRMVTFSSIGSAVPAGVEAYRLVDGALQLQGCAYDFMTSPSVFQVEPDVTYYLMAGPSDAGSVRGTITVTIDTLGTPPAHDSKAGAIDIGLGTVASDSTGGTTDADDFSQCGYPGGATVWHRYVPATDGRIGVSVSTDGYSPILHVGRQTEMGIQGLGCVGASDVPIFVDVVGGETHWFLLGNATGQLGGPYRLTTFDAPRLEATLTVEGGTVDRSTGAATIRGTVRCSQESTFSLAVQVKQRGLTGLGFAPDQIPCGSVAVAWEVMVHADTGSFGNGPADVEVGGTVYTQFDSSQVTLTTSLVLRSS